MPGLLALSLAVAALCAADDGGIATEKTEINNSSEKLAKSLQRQLMRNNYDYMSSEGEERPTHVESHQARKGTLPDGEIQNEHLVDANVKPKKKIHVMIRNKNIAAKFKGENGSYSNNKRIDHLEREGRLKFFRKLAKRRKKVERHMYNLDGNMAKRYNAIYKYGIADGDHSISDQYIAPTTTVKYRVLKLRSPSRRSGYATALIQEESPHAVSIVKLGIGPFPEFRLPHPRRQYMDVPQPQRAVEDDEEDLPPPPINDTTKSDVDIYSEINEEPHTVQVPKI